MCATYIPYTNYVQVRDFPVSSGHFHVHKTRAIYQLQEGDFLVSSGDFCVHDVQYIPFIGISTTKWGTAWFF